MKKILSIVVALILAFAAVGCDAKAATITLDATTASIEVGESKTLVATVVGSEEKPTWTSDKVAIATVDASGKVTAVSVGTAIIKAKVGTAEADCTITVKAAPVITLDSSAANLEIGATKQITATVTGSTAAQVWKSSAPTIATVSATGLITAVAAGTATVTVTVGSKSENVAVKVFGVPTIAFDSATATAIMGEALTLDPAISREDYSVLWSSSAEDIATVSDTGIVTPRAIGSTTITVKYVEAPTVLGTCVVTVKLADKITLNSNSITLKAIGDEFQLVGSINNGIIDPIVWSSSDSEIISVSETGLIKAVKIGNAKITASAAGKTSACDVAVQDFTGYTQIVTPKQFMDIAKGMEEGNKYVLANDLDFTGFPIPLGIGFDNGAARSQFNAIFDGNGYAIKNLLLGTPGATVDGVYNNGLFCNIGWKGVVKNVAFENTKAGFGGHTGIITDLNYGLIENINFINCEVQNLAVWNARTGGVVGKNMPKAIIRNVTGKITATGTKTGVEGSWGGGAIAGGNDGTIVNCIIDANVQSETETKYEYLVYKKTDLELAADNVLRRTIEEQKNVNLYSGWDLGLWNISSTAAPTLKNAGVEAPLVVEMENDTAKIYTGYTQKLIAFINQTGKTIVWGTSDPAIATVVSNGTVTAVGVGECKITATVGEAKAECTVTIAKAPIRLNQKLLNVGADETFTLTYELANEDAKITWASSDVNVAMVSAAGVVTGVGFGTANITATVDDLTVTCIVSSGTVAVNADFTTLTELSADWTKTLVNAASTIEIKDGALRFSSKIAGANSALMFPTDKIIGKNQKYIIETTFAFNETLNTGRYFSIRFAQTGTSAYAQVAIRQAAKTTAGGGIEFAQYNVVPMETPGGMNPTSTFITYQVAAKADIALNAYVNVKIIVDGQNFTLFINGSEITNGSFKKTWATDKNQPVMGKDPIFDTYTSKNIQLYADGANISVKDIMVMVDPDSAPVAPVVPEA